MRRVDLPAELTAALLRASPRAVQVWLALAASDEKLTQRALAELCGCTSRTIRLALSELSALGISLWITPDSLTPLQEVSFRMQGLANTPSGSQFPLSDHSLTPLQEVDFRMQGLADRTFFAFFAANAPYIYLCNSRADRSFLSLFSSHIPVGTKQEDLSIGETRISSDIHISTKKLSINNSQKDTPQLFEPQPEPPPGFAAFWEIYPRRVGKLAAEKAWIARLKAGANPAEIVAGAKRYRADPGREDRFTAHPATWLRAGRWEDDPLPARSERREPDAAQTARTRAMIEQMFGKGGST